MLKIKPKNLVLPLIVLLVVFGIFCALEFNSENPYFSGYDSFYHVGMAKYIMEHGLPHQFPYLYFTTLNQNFTDNHLLFHLLLIPFVKLMGEVVGPKIFIALMVGLSFTFLYVLLRRMNFRYALPFTALAFLLESCDFYFRQAFVRDPAPSLFFLMLAIYFLYRKKLWPLTILAFLYGWLYTGGGFLFLIVLLIIYGVVTLVLGKKLDLKLVAFPIVATGLSLIINPYFPANINSIFLQVWQTGIGAKQYSGGEWYPYDTWFWLSISYLPLLIFVGSVIIALRQRLNVNRFTWTMFLFALFLLLMEWKAKRFVEYWPFFGIFSGILLAGKQVEQWGSQIFRCYTSQSYKKHPGQSIAIAFLLGVLLVTSCIYANTQWSKAWHDTSSKADFNVDAAQGAHNYLIEHSQPGDIVFTDDWDVFPLYFFLNQKDYYIVGLDPEFMNQYNAKLYQEFAAISSGMSTQNLAEIKNTFHAKWVIVAADHLTFRDNLRAQPNLFQEVYSNQEYFVFQVK